MTKLKRIAQQAFMASLSGIILTGSALAQQVVLSAKDGSADITGDLVSFEDDVYTLQTSVGELTFAAADVSCTGDSCPRPVVQQIDFRVSGAGTIGDDLMPLLITGYGNQKDALTTISEGSSPLVQNVVVVGEQGFGDTILTGLVTSEGTSQAFEDLLDGEAVIGMASRRIVREEALALKEDGAGVMVAPDQEHVIAVDSLRIIVSSQNSINALSIEQLADIYSGQITNWSELGGDDIPIRFFARSETSGTRGVFDERVLAPHNRTIASNAIILPSNDEMTFHVNSYAGGIGYVGFAYGQVAKSVDVITECGIRSKPTEFTARTESYPFQRRLYLYTREDTITDTVTDFLDYAGTSQADALIGKAGFIDLGVERVSMDAEIARLDELLFGTITPLYFDSYEQLQAEMLNWERLSTTFRFPSGSTRLSKKAQNDLTRLIDYLEAQPDGTRVAIVGFTDDEGPFQSNLTLSATRAGDVLEQIHAAEAGRLGNIEFTSMGFGAMLPEACNNTPTGKAINRRVEVWIR